MLESTTKNKIKKHLESHGFQVICLINVALPGIADLIVLKPDRPPLFIEVKQEIGKESPLQVYRRQEYEVRGYNWIVVYGYADFLEKVEKYIIIRQY